jgi:hypothetical protein
MKPSKNHNILKPSLAIICLLVLSCCSVAQVPKAKYFDSLQGSVWLSTEQVNDSSIFGKYEIGLQLWELPLEALKKNTMVWIFTDSLRVQYHNAATHKDSTVFTCKYEQNKPNHEIQLFLARQRILAYHYNSISTGSYVMLTRKSGKRKNR